MAIAFRNDMFGNDPEVTFDDPAKAVEHMAKSPAYEIIPDNELIRPYGDLDGKAPPEMSETEFNKIDSELTFAFINYFESINKNITLYSGSSYAYKKWSLRWTIPDCSVRSKRHAKAFAKDLYSRLSLPSQIKADLSVYSKNQKMRTLNTSKPNENRPFVMITDSQPIDTLISYTDPTTLLDFEIEEDPVNVEYKPTQEYDQSYVTQLCNLIAVEHWTNYESCQSLIFCLLSIGACDKLIHRYCAKAPNYSHRWVQSYISRYNPIHNKHSVGTLKHFAKLSDEAGYKLLKGDSTYKKSVGKLAVSEITQLTMDENTLYEWCDEKGYLKELPRDKTVASKSHLSTGKTRQMIKECEPSPFNGNVKTIAVFSCRQTFTSHITAELNGFVDYRKCKKGDITHDKVVIQLQSSHRIANRVFDLVILDEVESILFNLSPNKTHKKFMETVVAFESIVRSAKRVICLDAFLTDRTMTFLKDLRGDAKLVINPTQPFNKKAKVYGDELAFTGAVRKKLLNNKRVISVWGTKKAAKNFHETLPNSMEQVYYSSETDPKQKDEHLANVNEHWSEYQCVGYTSSITVGINYTHKNSFDVASLYATPWGCNARDYAQALHRARKLNDNEIVAFISRLPKPCAVEAGYDEQERMFKENTYKTKHFLESIGECIKDYTVLPEWLHKVLMWNRNEIVTNWLYFNECMEEYLRLCGVTVEYDNAQPDIKKKFSPSTYISVEEVADIDDGVAEQYNLYRTSLSELQQYQLEKYFLSSKVVKIDQHIWELWLKDRAKVERAYALFMKKPKDLINYKVLDLVPKDSERLKILQDLSLNWDKEWTVSVDEFPTIDLTVFGLRKRSEKETKEQYCRDFCKVLKDWCGVKAKVDRKRSSKGDRSYIYSIQYEPEGQVFSYIPRKFSFLE
jgi:hypothetical protein